MKKIVPAVKVVDTVLRQDSKGDVLPQKPVPATIAAPDDVVGTYGMGPYKSEFVHDVVDTMNVVNAERMAAFKAEYADPAESLWRSENPNSTEKFCDLAPGYRAELLKRVTKGK